MLSTEKSSPLSGIALVSETVLGGTNAASYAFGVRGGVILCGSHFADLKTFRAAAVR
jgi:hypothetical protein